MTVFEYCMALRQLKLEGRECAELFGYTRQVHYATWAKKGPPKPVAMLLRLMIREGWSVDDVKALGA